MLSSTFLRNVHPRTLLGHARLVVQRFFFVTPPALLPTSEDVFIRHNSGKNFRDEADVVGSIIEWMGDASVAESEERQCEQSTRKRKRDEKDENNTCAATTSPPCLVIGAEY